MPTGYTAAIADGITFERFALNCARAFGALVSMRDEPADAPIPERFEPSDYDRKAVQAAQMRLDAVQNMTLAEAAAASVQEYYVAERRHRKAIAKAQRLRKQYQAMLNQVVLWQPPTSDHGAMKDFMLQQIRESIRCDCDTEYYEKNPPKALGPQAWTAKEIDEAEHDIVYHSKGHAEEVERTETRNAWLAALRQSLKASHG